MTARWARHLVGILLVFVVVTSTPHAWAHPIDSNSLTLREVSDEKFAVHWQTSSPSLMRDHAQPAKFPTHCKLVSTQLSCGPRGLLGAIELPWLEGSETRVIIQIDWRSGARLSRVLDGRSPRLTVYGSPTSSGLRYLATVAHDYTKLGVEHILTGYDHLLFVLAVTLLVREKRALIAAITAFTLAHSLTLTATVLGWVWLAPAPVETVIALSIVLACAECLRESQSLARRAPWLVTFVFGLLHGLGFASALLAIGLPEHHLPAALLFFNVGVELGQLGAIAVFVGCALLLRRWAQRTVWATRGLIYAMGSLAAYWTLERGFAMFVQ